MEKNKSVVDLEQRKVVDPRDPKLRDLFKNVQGNILKGHGREHSLHIFLKFRDSNSKALRASLKSISIGSSGIITSALQQATETAQYRLYEIPGGLFGGIYLSRTGYEKLGFAKTEIEKEFEDKPLNLGPGLNVVSNFLDGMKKNIESLGDPPVDTWELGYQGDIDAVVLIADDDESFLLRKGRSLITEIETFAHVTAVERGSVLRNAEEEGIEHFGYVDGRSQPIFLSDDLADEGPVDVWNPVEPLKIVLVPDKFVDTPNAFGSFVVFRKLEQDVLHFKVKEIELADKLGLTEADRERAGAMSVGRFEDGTPLVKSSTDGFTPPKENNFLYGNDPKGNKCPFHAHIRKTNPRDEGFGGEGTTPLEENRKRRIVRRGIPFGKRELHPHFTQSIEQLPTKGVGLLFMCFQASIVQQFAFMQQVWVNNEGFVKGEVGIDPIIGQRQNIIEQQFNPEWGADRRQPFKFESFVKMKGGEYFFAPSIPFFENL